VLDWLESGFTATLTSSLEQSGAFRENQRVAERARSQGVECATVQAVNDQPYLAIIEVTEQQGCSMIFMASHGRSGVGALLLGSVTQKVLVHSKIPVLVVR
jgi:nucleotide-binding universal stress UspA family protein